MNPYEGKSLTELLDGVPGYADPDLDALTAKYCYGKKIQYYLLSTDGWYTFYPDGLDSDKPVPVYTTDWRESGRLQVKYRLNVSWTYDPLDSSKEFLCVQKAINPDTPIIFCRVQKDLDPLSLVCRAITETAVIAALREMIERDKE